jgi:hypothetical protein
MYGMKENKCKKEWHVATKPLRTTYLVAEKLQKTEEKSKK